MKNAGLWILPIALWCAGGCGGATEQKAAVAQQNQQNQQNTPEIFVAKDSRGVRTTTVQARAIPDYLEITGRIVPDPTHVVHVFPSAGGRVVQMKVRPWDHVQKGQTLALIESGDVSRSMADYAKARTDAELKKKALDRASDLLEHRAIAQRDLEQAQADAQAADAERKTSLDHLHLLGVDPASGSNELQVLALRSGVILDIGSAQGEFSKSLDASQPLCTVADLDTVWVEGEVFEKDLSALKTNASADIAINAYPGEKWRGRVAVVGGAVDPVTRTLKVRVVLSNPGLRLKPEMFANLRVLRGSTSGIVVPVASVEHEGQSAYVFVAKESDHFQRQEVTVGRTIEDGVEIKTGLSTGAIIVSEGAVLLRAASQN